MGVVVISSSVLRPIEWSLKNELKRRTITTGVRVVDYGLSNSGLYVSEKDNFVVLVPEGHDVLGEAYEHSVTCHSTTTVIDQALDHVERALHSALAMGATVLVANASWPVRSPIGLMGGDQGSPRSVCAEYNRRLAILVEQASTSAHIIDYCSLVAEVGYVAFYDSRFQAMYRYRYSSRGEKAVARLIARAIAVFKLPRKKCIIFDLDNTIWGGVLGELGVEGIRLDYTGESSVYRETQNLLVELSERGILLAMASKNDEKEVWSVFSDRPEMVLERGHISAWRIGWQDKTTSILEIANEMGLSPDSLVFLDDSPHEIEAVRHILPEVHSIQVPEDPVNTAYVVLRYEGFDTFHVTDEDRLRKDYIVRERSRQEMLRQSVSVESYLKSLHQIATVEPLTKKNVLRAAQLTQRTNQYNLTLGRYSVGELETMMEEGAMGVVVSVRDRLGSHGQVGFAMVEQRADKVWSIVSFVMSCRVIGRGIESVLMYAVHEAVKGCGGEYLRGVYRRGPRNQPCSTLLEEHGFSESGMWCWDRPISKLEVPSYTEVEMEGMDYVR